MTHEALDTLPTNGVYSKTDGERSEMRTTESVLDMVLEIKPARMPQAPNWRLIEIQPHSVPWSSVAGFSTRLGIQPAELLRLIGVTERTALRRRAEGFLKPDEADRLLRIARVYEEATRVLGAEHKAAGWLNQPNPCLYDATPLSLLDSDGGAQAVSDELVRIDYGDFV